MSENTENQNPEEKQKQDNNKVAKRFEENTTKLLAVFNGADNVKTLSGKKIKKDALTQAIEELTKETTEERIKTFKEKAKAILVKKVEFDKFKIEQQKLMDQAVLNKMKEFNKEMEDCFNLITGIDEIKNEYKKSLGGNQAEPAEPAN